MRSKYKSFLESMTPSAGLSSLAAIVMLGGCAFAGVDRPPVEKNVPQTVINEFPRISTGEAMDIARSALQSAGFEVIAYTPELGEVRTKARQVPTPGACDCGTWNGSVIQGTALATYLITVDTPPPGDKALVKAKLTCGTTFTGRNLYGATTKVETYQCASTGQIEQQFWEKFRQINDVRRR
jgi:hypothetical protein